MYEIETEIDIEANVIGQSSDPDCFENNRGNNCMFPLGLEYVYKGKTIPCSVRWSPNGSITSQILRDAIHTLYHQDIFHQTNKKMPPLLLDGHQSRFEVELLEYITNANRPWILCIGIDGLYWCN